MDRCLIINRLNSLSLNLKAKSKLDEEISAMMKKLVHEKTRPIIKLDQFDSEHKRVFVLKKVGDAPIKPVKVLAIVVPVYKKKKKEYEENLARYNEAVCAAEEEYYTTFGEEREALRQADNKEREDAIQEITSELDKVRNKLDEITKTIEAEDIIGVSLKNVADVQLLIDIFDNRRADTIKEAVNILFEDKHRKRMEELQELHVCLTKEAKEAAENAEDSAREAIRIANEAMERADEAYSKAQSAYEAAENNYNGTYGDDD